MLQIMSPELSRPEDAFGLTEEERLRDRISYARFMNLVADEQTAVHQIEVSSNNYGEFLFCTLSRPRGEGRAFLSFWGCGFHESRERWLTDEWRWYETQQLLHIIP